jgi:hypothetical protein
MSNNFKLLALASAALLSLPSIGRADTINFAQWGGDDTVLSSPLTGTTTDGVTVTLTSPDGSAGNDSAGFTVYQEGTDWLGTFAPGAPVLADFANGGSRSGVVVLSFTSGLSTFSLAAQAQASGSFTETMTAYTGNADSGYTLVGTTSSGTLYNPGDSTGYENSIAILTVSGIDITKVVMSSTNDPFGVGLGAESVPEPASMTLLGTGLVGLMLRRRRRNRQALSE